MMLLLILVIVLRWQQVRGTQIQLGPCVWSHLTSDSSIYMPLCFESAKQALVAQLGPDPDYPIPQPQAHLLPPPHSNFV